MGRLITIGNVKDARDARAVARRLRAAADRAEDHYRRGFQDGFAAAGASSVAKVDPAYALVPVGAAQPISAAAPAPSRADPTTMLVAGILAGLILAAVVYWMSQQNEK